MPEPQRTLQPALPERIDKYTVVGVAGEGNMGTVYVGHDPFTDENVAIKVCPVTRGSGFKIARKLFFNEAHTAGSLDHPNILSILDAGEQDGLPYIVMEYVDGADTLRSHVTPENLLPLPRVVELLYQCAKALDYAHRRGVIHRDIKPSNIMLTSDGVVKIGDFGIAQHALSEDTQVMGMLGSPRYMSPEQLQEQEFDHRTDIYALGVVAYELVTGHPPFVARTIAGLARKIIHSEPAPVALLREDAPANLCSIITKAMAKRCEERYEYAHEMAADLASLFGRLDHVPSQPSRPQRFNVARALTFFNHFSDAELEEVLAVAEWREARAGATVIAECDAHDAFYVLAQGEAVVELQGQCIGTLTRDDCFGETALLADPPRGSSVLATEACTLLRIDCAALEGTSAGCQLRFNQSFVRAIAARLSRSGLRLAAALNR